MGIVPVHYLLWSLRGLAPEKFGAMKLHDYLYRLELDTLMVNDRHSLQKESSTSEWNGMAVHRFTDDEQGAVIDDNYAHLIATLESCWRPKTIHRVWRSTGTSRSAPTRRRHGRSSHRDTTPITVAPRPRREPMALVSAQDILDRSLSSHA